MPQPLKVAVVADIHHGPEAFTKKGPAALRLLGGFADFVAGYGPDLVVDLGDRISDVDAATDRRLLAEVAAVFRRIGAPRRHLLGNHDVASLRPADHALALGVPVEHAGLDIKGWHVVLWQADPALLPGRGFALPAPDLDWLRADLAATGLPTLVFSHVPLSGHGQLGNYYFERNPAYATYPEHAEALAAIEASGKVAACIAGHVHWNTLTNVRGVPHLTLQSLTESFTTHPDPAGAYAALELDGEALRWRAFGRDGVELRLPLAPRRRWVAPLAPFAAGTLAPPAPAAAADLAGVEAVILDMDGVLYRGDEAVPGAAAFVDYLRASGRGVAALTNNARLSPEAFAAKLARLGIAIPAEAIVTSAFAAARRLAAMAAPEPPRVFVAGSEALRRELLAAGAVEDEARPGYVVVGMEPGLTVARLADAAGHVRGGARLVATNPDPVVPTPDGLGPECGAIVAFLEAATGRGAATFGKPHPVSFEFALDRLGVDRRAALMVGDTLETDIAGANAAGLRSALVATGNPPTGEGAAGGGATPTVRVDDLAELRALLDGADA